MKRAVTAYKSFYLYLFVLEYRVGEKELQCEVWSLTTRFYSFIKLACIHGRFFFQQHIKKKINPFLKVVKEISPLTIFQKREK